jgi:hypothetical protein
VGDHVHVDLDLAGGDAATRLGIMLTDVLREGLKEVDGPTPSAQHIASALYAVASSLEEIARAIKATQKKPLKMVKKK